MRKTNPHLFYLEGEAPGAPGLRATRCGACGAVSMPAAMVCPSCEGRQLTAVGIGAQATLLHHSVVLHGADGFEAPYIVGLVRTEEGPTAFVPILGSDGADLQTGSRLRFRTVSLGEDRVGFAYERETSA
jgi:uncharacterized OB-fold protein